MIVYNATKAEFLNDVLTNDIENIVLKNVKLKLNRGVGISIPTGFVLLSQSRLVTSTLAFTLNEVINAIINAKKDRLFFI
jgi:hypothetical protein